MTLEQRKSKLKQIGLMLVELARQDGEIEDQVQLLDNVNGWIKSNFFHVDSISFRLDNDYRLKPIPKRRVRRFSEIVAEAEKREIKIEGDFRGIHFVISDALSIPFWMIIGHAGHGDIKGIEFDLLHETLKNQWPDWFFENVEDGDKK